MVAMVTLVDMSGDKARISTERYVSADTKSIDSVETNVPVNESYDTDAARVFIGAMDHLGANVIDAGNRAMIGFDADVDSNGMIYFNTLKPIEGFPKAYPKELADAFDMYQSHWLQLEDAYGAGVGPNDPSDDADTIVSQLDEDMNRIVSEANRLTGETMDDTMDIYSVVERVHRFDPSYPIDPYRVSPDGIINSYEDRVQSALGNPPGFDMSPATAELSMHLPDISDYETDVDPQPALPEF